MKKLLLIMMMLAGVMFAKAQNYDVLYIQDIHDEDVFTYCMGTYDTVVIYGDSSCEYLDYWGIETYGDDYLYEELRSDSIVLTRTDGHNFSVYVVHQRCNSSWKAFHVDFLPNFVDNPITEPVVWKRTGDYSVIPVNYDLYPYYNNYDGVHEWEGFNFLWSTGENLGYEGITVIEPGIYWLNITDNYEGCINDTFYVEVRDNIELYRTTVDLETNLNKTTWQVTEEQAEYITDVKVYRDGLLVGTVPYEQGYYLDNIGSDNAARNYRIVGVSVEGEDCPIESYEKGTIHTTYYEDVNGNLNMTWNIPYVEEGAQGTLTYFQICKYDPNTGEITVVDQVNASITDYTCGVNQFDGGYAVIAAVFNDGKGVEELSFSNLTTDILSIGENGETAFSIYPNPAQDRVIVEGTGTMIVTNTLGQTVLVKEIDGKATIELPQGLYFVKMNGTTRKIVME